MICDKVGTQLSAMFLQSCDFHIWYFSGNLVSSLTASYS